MQVNRSVQARADRFFGPRSLFWLFLVLGIFLLRLLFTGIMGLMPQDAYYHLYGEHLDWSYFDHPPAIAYLLRFFTHVFGRHVFVVKWADSVVTLLMVLAFYRLAHCFLSARRALLACILLFSTFMVSTLSLVSTPDVPLMLFWTLSLYTLYQAVFLEKRPHWLLAGLVMGCAFDSKYTGLFLPAGVILFMLLSPGHRKFFRDGWFWAGVVGFFLTVFPVIWWNWMHQFASLRFQTSGRFTSGNAIHFSLTGFGGMLGHQMAILLPVLFVSLLWLIVKGVRKYLAGRSPVNSHILFLSCFFLPLFLFFMLISFITWVKLNWMMPAYISGILLVSRYLSMRWLKIQLIFSAVVHLAMGIEILFYPVPVKSDDTWFGWGQLAAEVKKLGSAYPQAFIFSADDYKTSAVLNFYSDSMIYGRNVIGQPALQFDYLGTDLRKLAGRDAIFLNSVPRLNEVKEADRYPAGLSNYFDSVTELPPILIQHHGKTVRKFLVFLCRNYHSEKTRLGEK